MTRARQRQRDLFEHMTAEPAALLPPSLLAKAVVPLVQALLSEIVTAETAASVALEKSEVVR
jgi:hypothetical protein